MLKLYFASDVHGSDICWKKFLGAAAYYKADVLILGGDMTGKAIVPVVQDGAAYSAVLLGSMYRLEGQSALAEFEQLVTSRGYYPVRMTQDERAHYAASPDALAKRFLSAVCDRMRLWLEMAEERLPRAVPCIVCPGNDDPPEIDTIIAASSVVKNGEGSCLDIGEFFVASTGWTNKTPWHTPREESEEALAARIAAMLDTHGDCSRTVFNFHCPPFSSGLDDAPELGEDLSIKNAGQSTVPVGSRAVRDAIASYKPLAALHGHIHEAKGVTRIAKTLCVNPGSLYEQGVLQGVLLDVDSKKGVRNYVLTTG